MSEAWVMPGDGGGVLHIMDLPRNLRRRVPSEVNTMQAFLMRQLARLDYLQACKPRRAQLLKVCLCFCLSIPRQALLQLGLLPKACCAVPSTCIRHELCMTCGLSLHRKAAHCKAVSSLIVFTQQYGRCCSSKS